MWTFGRKLALGFALAFVVLAVVGLIAHQSLGSLTETSRQVTHTHHVLERTAAVLSLLKDAETAQRGFVITGDESFLAPYVEANAALSKTAGELRTLTQDNPRQQRRLDRAEPMSDAKMAELRRTIELRRSAGFEATQKTVAAGEGKNLMDEIRRVYAEIEAEERELLEQRTASAEAAAENARDSILFGTLLGLVLVVAASVSITRSVTKQIGSAVQHVQSSSAELQAAARQQATGAQEQATAMAEITTTINELLATSRQIADSAQHVARIARETASAAVAGDETVQRTRDSVATIRRQVDVIVAHMLELGKKSQEIGGILEIVNELSEQTNILAVNATIEAAGAGEAGRRFAIVADEIRKLADRVGGTTKEIRNRVEEIRGAVNTTVMATEGGSKTVDAGTRQFAEVATSFQQIVTLVGTTTEAAKEIELSTKQQASAVEQVNVAAANVSQAAKETEVSSGQTLQTSSDLASLSQNLVRLIRPQAGLREARVERRDS